MQDLVRCINLLENENQEVHISDEATDTSFTIWFNKDKSYMMQMFQCDLCRRTFKDKETLLELLGKDINIFTRMQKERETFNFECKSI